MHLVDQADDGSSALPMVKKSIEENNPYDIIFLDNIMLKMNGPKAAQAIRHLGFSGLLYGITGIMFEADIEEFQCSGVDAVYSKPLEVDVLNGMLMSLDVRHVEETDMGSKSK